MDKQLKAYLKKNEPKRKQVLVRIYEEDLKTLEKLKEQTGNSYPKLLHRAICLLAGIPEDERDQQIVELRQLVLEGFELCHYVAEATQQPCNSTIDNLDQAFRRMKARGALDKMRKVRDGYRD